MTDGAGRRLTPWLAAAAGYAVLTLTMMWPVVAHISSAFPHDRLDPALNTWILWWNAQAIPLTEHWRNAPIFWPMQGSLSLSEHLVGISILTTPLLWAGVPPVAAYNIAWLLSFPLCALAVYGLVFALVGRHDAAALAGLVFGFNPYRVAHAPQLQMLWAFGMPLVLLSLHRYVDNRRRVWLAVFAAAWVIQALSNGYYLLFFPVLLACWIVWFAAGRSRTAAAAITSTWGAASLALVPFLWSYFQTLGALNLTRRYDEIEMFSADAIGLVVASPDLALWQHLSKSSFPEGELFPGAVALALVIAGVAAWKTFGPHQERDRPGPGAGRLILTALTVAVVVIGLSRLAVGPWRIAPAGVVLLSVESIEKPMSIALALAAILLVTSRSMAQRWREASALTFYMLASALTYLLSLGPRIRFAGTPVVFHAPYYWLLKLPGFSGARSPARFGMLFVLCLAVTAALVFERATRAFSQRWRRISAFTACALIVAESWPTIAVTAVPPPILALQRADPNAPVVELPAGQTERDSAALFRSMQHRRPVVNGYSGYVPPHYQLLAIGLRLNDSSVLAELARDQPLTVAIDRREEFERWAAIVTQCHGEQIDDDGEWRTYRVPQASPVEYPSASGGAVSLPIASASANVGPDDVKKMLDGDPSSGWNSGRAQSGGEEVAIDLGAERFVAAVRLTMGWFIADFPRRLTVECAGESSDWRSCWNGSAAGLAFRGVLEDSRMAPLTIPIGLDHVRRMRLRQTAADPVNGWSIGELAVLGR